MAFQPLVYCPKSMHDMSKLQQLYTYTIKSYHPRLVFFLNSLKELRSHALEKLQYSCIFPLLFPDLTDLDVQHDLIFPTHDRIVFYLRAVANDYAERLDTKSNERFS